VIVVLGELAIEAARLATTTIPIVGMAAESGLAASIARLGDNITGVNVRASEFDAKGLELLHEAVPASKPGDLPIEQSEKIDLVVLKAAKVLRLTIPQALLVRADEVIE